MMMLFITLIFLVSQTQGVTYPTPLQTYVSTPDPTYNYTLASTIRTDSTTTYILRLVSQTWLSAQEVRPALWTHWLEVVVPNQFSGSLQSGIYVDGDDDSTTPPTTPDINTQILAQTTHAVVARLPQIPNEPSSFASEGFNKSRTEDAVIAYTWEHFLQDPTRNATWLLRLPMVKAVVRAMDAIQDFLPKLGIQKPEKFIIAGASKRGWTTWLVPAVDTRVNGIVPMVMPILNMQNVINQMWRSLGLWTFAFKDYMDLDVMAYLNTPEFLLMADVIDPVNYMPYLEPIPKYMIFSTGDEFFLPDSARNFYDEIKGEFNLRMVPNSEHSLAPLDELVINNIGSFILYLMNNQSPPTLKETLVYSNTTATITVFPSSPPTQAKLWQATTISPIRRDFRLLTCGSVNCFQPVIWIDTNLKPNADGSYSASVSAPLRGWTGFLIELSYQTNWNSGDNWFQITSQVVIVPDIYPYPSCGQNCGKNATMDSRNNYYSTD